MLLGKEEIIRKEIHRLEHTNVGTSQEITDFLTNCDSTPLTSGSTLAELSDRRCPGAGVTGIRHVKSSYDMVRGFLL